MIRKIILFCVVVGFANTVTAQFIKERSINAQIGLGLTVPYNSVDDVSSTGFFIQGEYVLTVKSWLELKPYFGFITTNSNGEDVNGNPSPEFAEATAVFLGGKFRLRAPIPYVAPYIELGIGTSVGKFTTITAFDVVDKSGLAYHIPVALGLELGKNHGVDLGFTYYFQPQEKQFSGAVAVGLSFPID
ncbi:hypothetical protein DFQ05_0019 [Winogradskyella wandonensis]|uniref:Outer membrane protein with beta-barrel domain n=1 Tax=Winogradskyella wandonensis TaxID=1442586 RepID=A0A4V2PTZ1_9FLAO|nr:hypothetical protein [Winogradskyella wandonensis]TCK68511.1 hypothetical protein DFQ05_0019 [Winogradskyella wandonensis]